jgi:heme/copper-type cytochrome/quinol oxidase subunit 3
MLRLLPLLFSSTNSSGSIDWASLKPATKSVRKQGHPFHLVDASPLPFFVSMALGAALCMTAFFFHDWPAADSLALATIAYAHGKPFYIIYWGFFVLLLALVLLWGLIISDEITFRGDHPMKVQSGLRFGMVLFITSEVMFFFIFFWAFFHSSIAPAVGIGAIWPPKGIETLNPLHLPLANTVILLSSGVATVWAHRALIAGYKDQIMLSLIIACGYGLLFSWLQFLEYGLINFAISDGVFGSVFYMITGFHGFHVIVGTTLLLFTYWRLSQDHFSRERHLGFEIAAWYWHFVDVVWLFLYTAIYWWGSSAVVEYLA